MKLYKYASIDAALGIIKSHGVYLSHPTEFNDPYDTILQFDNRSEDKTVHISEQYQTFKIFSNLWKSNRDISTITRSNVQIDFANMKYSGKFSPSPLWWLLTKRLSKSYPEIKDSISKQLEMNNQIINNYLSDILITCFSKRKDSMLMWSHYADSHKGVCIEFEDSKSYWDIDYSKKLPLIKTDKLIRYALGQQYLQEDSKEKHFQKMLSLLPCLYTKSIDWAYEKEVRYLTSKNNIDGIYQVTDKNGNPHYVLPLDNIKAVYIGCKTKAEDITQLKAALSNKDVPLIQMERRPNEYRIIEDHQL